MPTCAYAFAVNTRPHVPLTPPSVYYGQNGEAANATFNNYICLMQHHAILHIVYNPPLRRPCICIICIIPPPRILAFPASRLTSYPERVCVRGSSDTVRDNGGDGVNGIEDPLFCLHVVSCESIGDDETSATQPSDSSHLDMAACMSGLQSGLQVTSKNKHIGTPDDVQRSPGIDADVPQHVPGMMPADVAACEGKSRDGAPPTFNGGNLRGGEGEEPAAPSAPSAPTAPSAPPAPRALPLKSHWKKVKKADRAARFVDFVIEHLGIGRLGASTVGVLDVAGGSGCVAFELSFRHHIPCTTVR